MQISGMQRERRSWTSNQCGKTSESDLGTRTKQAGSKGEGEKKKV